MPSSKSTIAIYVATERQATEVKGQMAPYRPGTQVGCMGGLGSNPLFMSDLESTLMSGSPGVDMVIFDEASMAEAMGGDGKALVAIVEILSHGLARHIGSIIVYDSMHCINATGVKRLSTMGATVVTDLAEVGGDFARRYGNWDRYADVDPSVRVGPKGGTLPAIGDEGRGDAARRDGLDMPVREDPFDRIAHDPFEGMRDAGRQDEDDATGGGDAEDEAAGGSRGHGGDPGESIGFDPFDIVMQATERGPGGGVSLDDFMRVNMGVGGGESDSYGSDRDRGTKGGRRPDDPRDLKVRRTEEPEWEDFYERQGVPDDLRALAREAADPTSEWIYDDLNESLNGGAGFIRKMKAGKRGGRQVSEVEPHALADSIYIPQYQAENDTAYSVPPETRILSCYSPAGGSGKTTVAGMIAIQLNWCFNREVMLHRSSAWTCRVLIMSMNEFDDLSVKGLGAPGPMVDEDNHKTIEDLLRIIEDCGGAPTWEEISDCFATNKENYVYYLPSVSLRQRVEHDVNLTSEDYRKVLHVCAKFFEFIILDMPDVMYDHRGGVVEFALNNSNIVVYIMEPDKKSTYLLYQLLMGLVDDDGNRVISPDKWMLVLNKYAKADSPYAGYIEDLNNFGQVSVETVMQTTQNLFFDFKAIPLTSRRASGNILFGRDPYVKQAARDIVDSILRRLDEQEVERTTKKKKH